MLFRSLLWSLPLSCALLPGLSQAHLYLAADAGTGHFHASCPSGHSCDSSGTGYDAALGYELGHGISVEGGYASFGDDTVATTSSASASGPVAPRWASPRPCPSTRTGGWTSAWA
jgi:hypothetical protein